MNIGKLSPVLQNKAIKELNENPARIPEDIRHIKEWIKKEPHLISRTDDDWILLFLRGCKFNLNKTKKKIDTYYTMKNLSPEVLRNRDPLDPDLQIVLEQGTFLPVITTDELSPISIVMRLGHTDPSILLSSNIMKVATMICDILVIEENATVINGINLIIDMKGVTLLHVASPVLIQKCITILQEGCPFRMQGLHFFHPPRYIQIILNSFKHFLTKKLQNRIFIHPDGVQTLFEEHSKSHIPVDFGGDAPSILELTDLWKKKVESYRNWFLECEKYGTDEKKRVGKPNAAIDIFGSVGSFRKLELD